MNIESRHKAGCQCGACPLRIVDKKLGIQDKLATTDRAEAERILEARKAQLAAKQESMLEARIGALRDRLQRERNPEQDTQPAIAKLDSFMDAWEKSAIEKLTNNLRVATGYQFNVPGVMTDLPPVAIAEAKAAYIRDRVENIRSEGGRHKPLGTDRLKKYTRLLNAWESFCSEHGIEYVGQFTPKHAQTFRKTWKDDPEKTSLGRKNENFKTVFEFFVEERFIRKNPIYSIEEPTVDEDFTQGKYIIKDEDWQCMKTCVSKLDQRSVDRTRAQILFGWDTGCRISDIVSLERAHVDFEKKMFDKPAKKNQKRNYGPLSDETIEALKKIPDNGTPYFFWTGNGLLKSAVSDTRRPISRLLKLCKSIKFNLHMFRHTRVTKRLESGMSFEDVAHMVGDTVEVIKRHYFHASKEYKIRVSEQARKSL